MLQQQPLPNTNCQQTFEAEKRFLEEFTPPPYKYKHDELSTVIFSRTLNTHYLWPLDKPLNRINLEAFQMTGHTLGIDNSKSYYRMFNLDLDCMCRRNPSTLQHLNAIKAKLICTEVENLLKSQLKLSKINISLWQNKCGFHIYTDVCVSLPTHLFLWKLLCVIYGKDETVLIEVPTIMPLPYSSKEYGKSYKPILDGLPFELTMSETLKLYEMYEYGRLCRQSFSALSISTTGGHTIYMTKRNKPTVSHCTPRFFNVTSISVFDDFEFMAQMKLYIETMMEQYSQDLHVLGRIDFSDVPVDDKKKMFTFLNMIGQKFNNTTLRQYAITTMNTINDSNPNARPDDVEINIDQSNACNLFVYLSTIRYGCLYLEPFAAALCKHMNMDIQQRFTDFRKILELIYANVRNQAKSINQFIKFINLASIFNYIQTAEEILDCLAYYINNDIDPTASIVDQIDTIMTLKMNATSSDVKNDLIHRLRGPDAIQMIGRVIDAYQDAVYELRLVTIDSMSRQYLIIYSDGGRSYFSNANFFLPAIEVLTRWLDRPPYNHEKNGAVFRNINELNHSRMITKKPPFNDGSCTIATKLGTFNHITGLYSASTWLLNFKKYRNSTVYNYNEGPLQMSLTLNESIVDNTERAMRMMQRLEENISEFYLHAIVVPAILQLRYVISIDSYTLKTFFINMSNHESFDSAHFLVECYPIDPRFIYLTMYLYDSIDMMISYKDLCQHCFQYRKATKDLWQKEYMHIYNECIYDDTLPTHLEKLCSLRGPSFKDNQSFNADTIFFVTIIVVCMLKCPAFNPLIEAFNVQMPEIKEIPNPNYHDFKRETTAEVMEMNFERAKRLLFHQLDEFEDDLLNEYISLCISTDFNPDQVKNLLNTIALSFLNYNVMKKAVIWHGAGNVGKSFLCDKMAVLTGPMIIRVRDFGAAFKRGESTGENVVTILNEAKYLNAPELKSVTGNDAESGSKFYSQVFEMQYTQSFLYGATNTHISFRHNKEPADNVDLTSVKRLYSLTLNGVNVNGNQQSSLFSMLTNSKYFRNIVQAHKDRAAQAMGWLAFATYLLRRDEHGTPYLDVNSIECRHYQNTVYYNNNKLYRSMVDSGISYEEHFSMNAADLLKLVAPTIEKAVKSTEVKSLMEFKKLFREHYNINLNDPELNVPNFQQTSLIQHIQTHFAVNPCKGNIIRPCELEERLTTIFTLDAHKENARNYFTSINNCHFCYTDHCYKNIAFTNQPTLYAGNDFVFESTINPDSLVVKSV